MSPVWDPKQYDRFKAERAQPFHDLIAHIPPLPARRVVDMGCGTGRLTATLLDRFPDAHVVGVDSSPEMLTEAARLAPHPRLSFVEGDLATWQPQGPIDVIVSNAALQWASEHGAILRRWASLLAPGGVIAVQMPNNGQEAAFRLLAAQIREPRWAGRIPARTTAEDRAPVTWYAECLLDLGLEVNAWETVYQYRMGEPADIVEFMKATVMSPFLQALDDAAKREFLASMIQGVERAYQRGAHGTWFPFRRQFFVGFQP